MAKVQRNVVIGFYKKRDLAFFMIALAMARVTSYDRLRFCKADNMWYIKVPFGSKLFWATWYGFLAGHYNRMGYLLGVDPTTLKWEKSLPAR